MRTDRMIVGSEVGSMHGLHGMHRLLVGWAAAIIFSGGVASVAALAAEPTTIPTASSGTAAPRCTVGQPCTFAAPIFACNYADAEKIAQAGPAQGNGVGMGLVRDQSCQTVPAGRPFGTEATKSAQVVYMTEAGKHLGYMPVGIFASVEPAEPAEPERQVPVRITTRGQDLMLFRRGPAPVAVRMSGQGTAQAVGLFRSGPAERQDYCSTSVGDSRAEKNRCLAMYKDDDDFPVRADCESRVVTVLNETYRLHHRPATFPADGNINPDRKWLWQNVATDEWLDGTTPSHEPTMDTAFDALCPGRRPDADHGLVLRDPKALYPPALQGVWTPNADVCARVRRARGGEPVEGALTIRERAVQGYEYREELNQLRRLDAQGWTADVSWSGEGDGGQASVGYRLLGETLLVTNGKTTQHLARCR